MKLRRPKGEFRRHTESCTAIARVYVGPGFRVRRAGAVDDDRAAIYEVVIWDNWTIYGIVLPEDLRTDGQGDSRKRSFLRL